MTAKALLTPGTPDVIIVKHSSTITPVPVPRSKTIADSTHKTIKDIMPVEKGNRVHKSGYLFTLLVNDKNIKRGIPVAFLACKSESQ
jgi:hypothetical protein